ncbi:MAG: FAD-dependent oxidoreductase [Rhodospirillales bacterium]|jgi:NADH:ubiquinone reductase (H+-translocating)|nr:FAD-dependent oxidoreductase [Rhodospirillales bacterium]
MNLTILGGGFAGVWAAMSAAAQRNYLGISPQDLTISLISNNPGIVIRPRLYEGANAGMVVPLQPLLDVIDVRFRVGHITDIDFNTRQVITTEPDQHDGATYDCLILATGSQMRPPPVKGADQYGFNIDTFAETKRFDDHVNAQMDSVASDPATTTIVIVGASFTGIELATELRRRLGSKPRLILMDNKPEVGKELGAGMKPVIEKALSENAIELHLNATLTSMDHESLTLESGKRILTKTVVFNTGLEASPLTRSIDAQRDTTGRVIVDQYLQTANSKSLFIAGDVAQAMTDDTHASLMSCQHALRLGRFAGYNAVQSMLGKSLSPYRQEDYTTCLALGASGAAFTTGWDRQLQDSGAVVQARKREILDKWIYPPSPDLGAGSIFQDFALEPEYRMG